MERSNEHKSLNPLCWTSDGVDDDGCRSRCHFVDVQFRCAGKSDKRRADSNCRDAEDGTLSSQAWIAKTLGKLPISMSIGNGKINPHFD
jgi:hypothetical protein